MGPKTTRSVQVIPDKDFSDFVGYVSPVTDLFLEKSVVVPHCLITISHPGNFLRVANVNVQIYAIARGTWVGHFTPVDDSSVERVNTLDTHVGHEHQVTSSQGDGEELLLMIDSGLPSSKKHKMPDLLWQYRGIFDRALRAWTWEVHPLSSIVLTLDGIHLSSPTPVAFHVFSVAQSRSRCLI